MNEVERMREVLGAARAELEPTRADRERVARSLAAKVARVGLLGGFLAKAAAAATRAAGGQSLAALGKLFVTSMLVTVVGTGGLALAVRAGDFRAHHDPAVRSTAIATVPRPSATAGAVTVEGSAAIPSERTGASIQAPAPSAEFELRREQKPNPPHGSAPSRKTALTDTVPVRPSPVENDAARSDAVERGALEMELALLQRARRAADAGDSSAAVALLHELDATYPRGVLLEERRALRVIVACSSGEAYASRFAAEFRRAYPGSVYTSRVASACDAAGRQSSKGVTGAPPPAHYTGDRFDRP